MYVVSELSKKLEILPLVEDSSRFIHDFESMAIDIDSNYCIVEPVETLFGWLKNIRQIGVKETRDLFLESIWITSECNVHEMISYFIQFIENYISFNPEMFQLCVLFHEMEYEMTKEFLQIHQFFPIMIHKITTKIRYTLSICSFLYLLMENKYLQMESIQFKIDYLDFNVMDLNEKILHLFNCLWIYPNIFRGTNIDSAIQTHYLSHPEKTLFFYYKNFIKELDIDKFIKYKKEMIPNDSFAQTIRNDNFIVLQTMLGTSNLTVNEQISISIFDDFKNLSLIDYSAYHGSLNCFNFLLLNQAKIDWETFSCAVASGSIEIIRKIYQHLNSQENLQQQESEVLFKYPFYAHSYRRIHFGSFQSNFPQYNDYKKNNMILSIIITISFHQNNIFDWLFDELNGCFPKFSDQNEMFRMAVENCNIYAIIRLINDGFNIKYHFENQQIEKMSMKRGYDKIFHFLCAINLSSFEKLYYNCSIPCNNLFASYGSLELMKYTIKHLKNVTNKDIIDAFTISVSNGFFDTAKYLSQKWGKIIFDYYNVCFIDEIDELILESMKKTLNNNMIKYLIDFFHKYPIRKSFLFLVKSNNKTIAQYLTELLLKNKNRFDFTELFIESAISQSEDIFHFFCEQQIFIDFEQVLKSAKSIVETENLNIISNLIDVLNEEEKERFISETIESIRCMNNQHLVDYLIKQNFKLYKNDLPITIFSSDTNENLEIIKLFLQRNKKIFFPNLSSSFRGIVLDFIQQKSEKILKNEIKWHYYGSNKDPLISAICYSDFEIAKILLDFYLESKSSCFLQIIDSFKKILDKLNQNTDLYSKFKPLLKSILTVQNIDINYGSSKTILQIACSHQDHEFVSFLLLYPRIDVNYDPHSDFKNVPLMFAIRKECVKLVELLLKHPFIDVNFCSFKRKGSTPLAKSIIQLTKNKNDEHYKTNMEITKLLLNHPSVDVNSCLLDKTRNTLLIFAIQNHAIEVVDILLENRNVDVNIHNKNGSTAFLESIISKQENIAKKVISHHNFHPDSYVLAKAYSLCILNHDEGMFGDLFTYSLFDVNQKIQLNKTDIDTDIMVSESIYQGYVTPLIVGGICQDMKNIEKIIHHHTFNATKSLSFKALIESIKTDNVAVFQLLFPIQTFVTSSETVPKRVLQNKMKILLKEAMTNQNHNILNYILSNKIFQIEENDFLSTFIDSIGNIDQMKLIFKYHKIDLSKTSTEISYFQQMKIICGNPNAFEILSFLLENGANPNIHFTPSEFPVQFLIENKLKDLLKLFIDSGKVYMNQSLVYFQKTYLHLAAAEKDSSILKIFLNNEIIDVNIEDVHGETPLFDAVRVANIENIKLLFQHPKLNYKKQNHKGDTVFDIKKKISKKKNCKDSTYLLESKSKEELLELLISLVK
ncbi:hypothetical protein TRFO_35704 [Tritrichomonas foetus]|uniref:Uncharacterized protein n=1 Tax=Tritrichomonas foetus TaxID=1144522 RepID=A0A1J4JKB6_9EUKA|nr:hypothetical protein TRFO_35704 [Tritrichomonas foetus]|eukprot:OHS98013.1 hypothetical protein TRFO_35704 [Tritrichomonas foetus]